MNARSRVLVVLVLTVATIGVAGPAGAAAPRQRMGVVASGYPPKAGLSELNDVACVDRSHCFAVGEARVGGKYRTLFERWTGSRWAVMPSPTPPSGRLRTSSISCSSANACLAVGFHEVPPIGSNRGGNALVERWDGTRWALLPAPKFGVDGLLAFTSVSCPAAHFCVAIGSNSTKDATPGDTYAVTATWNGTNWHEVHRDRGGTMEGVSCPSPRSCVAIFRPGKGNRLHRLVLANGRWTTHVDNLVGVQQTITFADIACVSPTSCAAVGDNYSEGSPDAAAAYHWNGRVWRTLHPGARMRLHQRDLYAVSCPTANVCVAVGETDRGTFPSSKGVPLVERFQNGQTAVMPASAAKSSIGTWLNAVVCFAGGLCRGVGTHFASGSNATHPFADEGVLF